MGKRILAVFLAISALLLAMPSAWASDGAADAVVTEQPALELDCVGAILMDAATGTVLFEKNADAALPPASVTKIMTLLLVMEAIDAGKVKLTDMVSTSANAASMGGSQIFLEEGEQMSLEDLLKSVIIASANDAAVALAEYTYGSEEAFVARMNERARELGMKTAHFENTNGLDDTVENHVLSARDIALMSRELIKHEKILEYSAIWMDTIRNGSFGLTNTNRLIRFYKDATGLKTGSTSKAGFCVSATAKRDGMHLICVVMGAESRDSRNAIAAKLLDYGFASYSLFSSVPEKLSEIKVLGGVEDSCAVAYEGFCSVLQKGEGARVKSELVIKESVPAPVKPGTVVGTVTYTLDGNILGTVEVKAAENIDKIGYFGLLWRMIAGIVLK